MLGLTAYYQAPESLILAKLRMIKATVRPERSVKDQEDIKAIIHNTKVDRRKIVTQARRESTLEVLTKVLPRIVP